MSTAPPIVPVDAARLRTLLSTSTDRLKRDVGELFRTNGWPSLAAEWTPEALYTAALAIAYVANTTECAFPIPVDTSGLKDRILALPDDLADRAAAEAKTLGLANVGHPNKWTVENYLDGDRLVTVAEALAQTRHRRIMAAIHSIPLPEGVTEEQARHALVNSVTNGRVESTKKLTGPEARALADWAEGRSMGKGPETPPPLTVDWKVQAKRLGTTQSELLKTAKAFAAGRRLDAPKKLEDVTNHRMIAALLMSAEDGSTPVMAAAEAALPPVSETPAAEPEQVVPPSDVVTPKVAAGIIPEVPEPSAEPVAEYTAVMAELAEATQRAGFALTALTTALAKLSLIVLGAGIAGSL